MHPADLRAGTQLPAGLGVATVLPDIDFETYSEAGSVFDYETQKWVGPPGAAKGKKGLFVVGAALYATHPTTEVLSLAYNLKDGRGPRRWIRNQTQPKAPSRAAPKTRTPCQLTLARHCPSTATCRLIATARGLRARRGSIHVKDTERRFGRAPVREQGRRDSPAQRRRSPTIRL